MIVKICGMRERTNVEAAARLCPDFLGFIFHEPSPRSACGRDLGFIRDLPEGTVAAGVFVDRNTEEIDAVCRACGIRTVQLHGHETPCECTRLKAMGYTVLKAFSVGPEFDWSTTEEYRGAADMFVFDAKGRNRGGNGHKFDWELLGGYTGGTPFLLSGGIGTADAEKIKALRFTAMAGVDLNSGFELSPGMKDTEALRLFIEKLKN